MLNGKFLLVVSIIYFIVPIDIIPDVIPLLGYSEDVSFVLLSIYKIKQDSKQK